MNKKNNIPYHSIGYHFNNSLTFPYLKGIGKQYITSSQYYWNSEQRLDHHCIIQYTISGLGELNFQGKIYPQTKDNLFIISIPSKSCYYLPKNSNHWEFIYLEISIEAIPIITQILNFAGPSISISNYKKLIKNINNTYLKALNNNIKTFSQSSKICYDILMELLGYVEKNQIQQTDYNDFAKIYINQKYHHSTLNLDEIADQVGISKYHLDRSFHQKFGITIFNYIKHLRIEKACRLLTENNNLKTKEIAIMVGFSSDNYFCKTFKKVKGISPNNYKQQSNQYDLVRSLINHQKN